MQKVPVLLNPKWMKDQHDLPCEICGKEGNTEGAHQRLDGLGGTAMKPPDDATLPLCHEHHLQEGTGWRTFYLKMFDQFTIFLKRCLLARAREIYREHYTSAGEAVLLDALQHYVKLSEGPGGARAFEAIEKFKAIHPRKNLWWRPK